MSRTASAASAPPKPLSAADEEGRKRLSDMIFAHALPIELEGLTPEERERMVGMAADLLQKREPGTHRIHVGASEGEAGQRRMPIVLLTDDMPFLVDTASNAIGAEGLDILRLIHPILHVGRDSEGNLVSIGNPAAPRESLILLETRRAPARKRTEIAARLDQAYGDVRNAVGDWQAMLAMLRSAARKLNDSPPPIAPHVLAESIAFLDWLSAENFTLLGASDGSERLGLMRNAERWTFPEQADDGHRADPVVIRKSPLRSTVHRGVPLDLITVHTFDSQGKVTGAIHFVGLFASAALRESPRRVPLLRRKVAEVSERLGYDARSHDGRALQHVIETFPREELFQLSTDELLDMASGLLSLQDRPRPQMFARYDAASHTASVFAYIPRDDYTAQLREKLGALIARETGATIAGFDVELRAEPLARVHFALQAVEKPIDAAALTSSLVQLTRGWDDELEMQLAERTGAIRAARLALTHGRAFGAGYRAEFSPADAAEDIIRLAELSDSSERRVAIMPIAGEPNRIRVKIYRLHELIPLSESVPIFENFGFRVIEEVPWDLADGEVGYIHSFILELQSPPADFDGFCALLRPALEAVLEGRQENDSFNALIPASRLTAEESNWLRAWFRYLRQTGTSYGVSTVVDALRRNNDVATLLIRLFRARLSGNADDAERNAAALALTQALDAVQGIDDDRILRLFKGLVDAILRTNAFVQGGVEALAFKLDSARVPGLPKPLPWREIWVYSPRVEGVHLRGGPIARGGLRWSDRRDDFRTEILGLVKAQMVKNSVIVPTGAKGGFYAKLLPDPAQNREAWAEEGRESYKVFIRALLSITDNLAPDGAVIPPREVVRLDGDDAYLVVAADKGTATFSDTANAIAEEAGFWLADAFASGGSEGYDHKAMGITARGAWVSVARHFAEMGKDVDHDPFTVVGVGDMSGDVFGNGMLLSKEIRLVAAFDHRHIFLDPAPDAEKSFAERQRLFALPRSSWADYDSGLISPGGGVFPRSQKSIPLSPEVQAVLGVTASSLDPSALIMAILKADVDLLWFGGIGTYVKSSEESNADVGDRANDAHRVNGVELRAKVVGEGANLGVTQAGRIQFALSGGRINTDFIDNSAGVDTSDHEVNIKIALSNAERSGKLERPARNALLVSMTDDVAELVLSDNRAQTLALSVAESRAPGLLDGHVRLMESLEASGRLDRQVEGLPDAREIEERSRKGIGLTRPELAVLLSYVKMELKDELVLSPVATDALVEPDVVHAFPHEMQESYGAEIAAHPLRKEIAATKMANLIVNRGGTTLVNDLAGELGCSKAHIVSAFVAARALFNLPELWRAIDAADVEPKVALGLHAEAARVMRVLVGDLARRPGADHPSALAQRLAPGLNRLLPKLDQLLRPEPRAIIDALRSRLTAMGSPDNVTGWLATLHALSGATGIVDLAAERHFDEAEAAEAYTRVGEALGIDWARGIAAGLLPADSWERLLVSSTMRNLETMRLDLIRRITPEGGDPLAKVEQWLKDNADRVARISGAIARARAGGKPTLAMLAHLTSVAQAALSD